MQREGFKRMMDEKTQEIEKENDNIKALEESDDHAGIEKSKAKIQVLQTEKESLKALAGSEKFRRFTERD